MHQTISFIHLDLSLQVLTNVGCNSNMPLLTRMFNAVHLPSEGSGLLPLNPFQPPQTLRPDQHLSLSPAPPNQAAQTHQVQQHKTALDLITSIASSIYRAGQTPHSVFARVDRDRNGMLSRSELDSVITPFEPYLSPQERETVFQHFDRDRSGGIVLNEFCQALQDAHFDKDRNGAVDLGEFCRALQEARVEVVQAQPHQTLGPPSMLNAAALVQPPLVQTQSANGMQSEPLQQRRLSEEVIARIADAIARGGHSPQDLFARLDRDGNGRLSRAELEQVLVRFEPNISLLQREAIFEYLDRDRSGQVDFREFWQALQSASAIGQVQRKLVEDVLSRVAASIARAVRSPQDLFAKLDVDGNGRLSRVELEQLLERFQPDLSPFDREAASLPIASTITIATTTTPY
jgi:Ca2+-binding EF-hand superfamily protein